jgi:hypothetical protein
MSSSFETCLRKKKKKKKERQQRQALNNSEEWREEEEEERETHRKNKSLALCNCTTGFFLLICSNHKIDIDLQLLKFSPKSVYLFSQHPSSFALRLKPK